MADVRSYLLRAGPWDRPRRPVLVRALRRAGIFLLAALGGAAGFLLVTKPPELERALSAARDSAVAVLQKAEAAIPLPPIAAAGVRVIEGDTVRAEGEIYRLVGFDTPETGRQARCQREHDLGARATARLRELVANNDVALARVACACRPGTEGTRACNFGRLCGRLTAGGRDVGPILISEGLARPYHCSGTRCPPRGSWC